MLRKPKPEDVKLSTEINSVLDSMAAIYPDDPNYPTLLAHLKALNELKQNQKTARRVSPDQMALIAGNLAGILLIVSYEHVHVVTSKALTLLVKVK